MIPSESVLQTNGRGVIVFLIEVIDYGLQVEGGMKNAVFQTAARQFAKGHPEK